MFQRATAGGRLRFDSNGQVLCRAADTGSMSLPGGGDSPKPAPPGKSPEVSAAVVRLQGAALVLGPSERVVGIRLPGSSWSRKPSEFRLPGSERSASAAPQPIHASDALRIEAPRARRTATWLGSRTISTLPRDPRHIFGAASSSPGTTPLHERRMVDVVDRHGRRYQRREQPLSFRSINMTRRDRGGRR